MSRTARAATPIWRWHGNFCRTTNIEKVGVELAKRKLGGLGRGLDSLFADLPEEDAGRLVRMLEDCDNG